MKVRSSGLRQQAFFALIASGTYAATQWGLISLIIKRTGATGAGLYAIGMAIIAPVVAIANLGLRSVQVNDSRRRWSFGEYIGLRITAAIAGLVMCIGVYAFSRRPPLIELVAFASLAAYRFAEAISDIAQGEFQLEGRYGWVAATTGTKALVGLALFAYILHATGVQALGFLVLAIVSLSVLLLIELRRVSPEISVHPELTVRSAQLAKEALPLAGALIINSFQVNVPRYVLDSHGGPKELGVYASLGYLVVLATFIAGAVGNAVAPRLGAAWDESNAKTFAKILKYTLLLDVVLGIIFIVVSIAIGKPIVAAIYNAEIAARTDLLPLFGLMAILSCIDAHLGMAVTSMKQYGFLLTVHICRVALTLTVSYTVIPRMGIRGAIWTTITSSLFAIVISQIAVSRWLKSRSEVL